MSFPCSFSSSSLLTVPGAFFSAVARACAIVIFGLAVVSDANAPRATTLARVTAVVSFLIMCGQTRRRCMALHKFLVNFRMAMMDYQDVITVEADKRGGQPCIRGLRITVYDVLSYLASGMSEEEIISDFPDLTHDDIMASLSYAADRERKTAFSHA